MWKNRDTVKNLSITVKNICWSGQLLTAKEKKGAVLEVTEDTFIA